MKLITKNGWTLTEYTSRVLLDEFDGTEEELIVYVLNNNIEYETFSKVYGYWVLRPRFFIGRYDLHPDSSGIIATEQSNLYM